MKNIPNIITFLRIIFAAAMIFTVPFTAPFWLCYLGGGLSDWLDGAAARGLGMQSQAGARLDSIADFLFGVALAVTAVRYLELPLWLWAGIACTGVLRLTGYGIGYYKYHTFSALHTYANKAAGLVIFAFPLLCWFFGLNIAGGLALAAAFVSALEELLITAASKELDRDRKGLFLSGFAET